MADWPARDSRTTSLAVGLASWTMIELSARRNLCQLRRPSFFAGVQNRIKRLGRSMARFRRSLARTSRGSWVRSPSPAPDTNSCLTDLELAVLLLEAEGLAESGSSRSVGSMVLRPAPLIKSASSGRGLPVEAGATLG